MIDGWSAEAGVVLVTLAPELPGALGRRSPRSRERGVVVSIGHTDGDAAAFAAARAAGAGYVTHLFNAMRPFAHRDPGPIGAALADGDVVAGLICDGIHVDPVAVAMAWRALGPGRLNLVTDAVAALGRDAGGPDEPRLGRRDGRTSTASATPTACSPAACCRSTRPCATSSPSPGARWPTPSPRSRRRRPACSASPIAAGWRPGRAPTSPCSTATLRVVATIVGGEVAWRS